MTPYGDKSRTTLAQVMACYLSALSHYLNQCWLIFSKVHWHSFDGNSTRDSSSINQLSKILLKSPRDQWVLMNHKTKGHRYFSKCLNFWEITTLIQKTFDIAVVSIYATSEFHTPVTCRIHDDHSITPTCGVERLKLAICTETCKIATIWLTIEPYKFNNILWSQTRTHTHTHRQITACISARLF